MERGQRVDSRLLEERVQQAVREGHRVIEIIAHGQHGIGGRLWAAGREPVHIRVRGAPGQRVGAMGFPNTTIEVLGPASDDVGWLNAGATITIHGNATNGTANAMAQGKIYVACSIGARGMTMTKHNPRFAPPELWVLGGTGDFFAEFMAGGIAVVCGVNPSQPDNVLGYRPCVGMVGGRIFFCGRQQGWSTADARLQAITDADWDWLTANMAAYLAAIARPDLLPELTADRSVWRLLVALKPGDKRDVACRSVAAFRREVWDVELGVGGLIGDLTTEDRSPIDIITTGEQRRFAPVWENGVYLAPCQANCPTGIPVRKRWELVRAGRLVEAIDLALAYTPFPATVCGYLCPHLCMQHCSRTAEGLPAVDIALLGQASLEARIPPRAELTGRRIAVIGGGPAGLSVAWQLWLAGHEVVIFERREELGGKISEMVPRRRIPEAVLARELARLEETLPHEHLGRDLAQDDFIRLRERFAVIVVATGARIPRRLPVPGAERAVPAGDFLRASRRDEVGVGRRVVIIGAGNVGCDAAAEAFRLGAQAVTLIDIQAPASFGRERQPAAAAGAVFLWPRFAMRITEEGVVLTTGEVLPADTVITAIGDQPDLSFLPDDIAREGGFVRVDGEYRSSDPRVFAIGDAVRLGLLTEAIGAGCTAAKAIDELLRGRRESYDRLPTIDVRRVKLEYFEPQTAPFTDTATCAVQCASCGACRDCRLCEVICPQAAISRRDLGGGAWEYTADAARCIGCGFCAGTCPTGVWTLVENVVTA